MKYFGTYTDNQDLVPKSYVDKILYSHEKYSINVANRLVKREKNGVEYFEWDNYCNEDDNGGENYVVLFIDNDCCKSTSIYFTYDKNDLFDGQSPPENFPETPNDTDSPPTDSTIYYVLGLSEYFPIGTDIFLYLSADSNFDTYKIRVLIPYTIEVSELEDGEPKLKNKEVYFNGRHIFASSNDNIKTRNGYIDLTGGGINTSKNYSTSATIHIYFDGNFFYIDRYPQISNVNSV